MKFGLSRALKLAMVGMKKGLLFEQPFLLLVVRMRVRSAVYFMRHYEGEKQTSF